MSAFACQRPFFAQNGESTYCSPDEEVLKKSRAMLVDELRRCDALGLTLYNFHPGSSKGEITPEACCARVAASINAAHAATRGSNVVAVVENMCRQGHTVGGRFEELAAIIAGVEDKARVGVCLDTCHAFAAGYDLSTDAGYDAVVAEFDAVVGLQYLRALHLNDSKAACGSHKDRHECIGQGQIGMGAFRRVMNDARFDGLPMVLETPARSQPGGAEAHYTREVAMLYGLVDGGDGGDEDCDGGGGGAAGAGAGAGAAAVD